MITSFLNAELHKRPITVSNSRNETSFLPERLIDVGVDNLRLVERNSINERNNNDKGPTQRLEYCALSYCWGPYEDSKSQTKTTRITIRNHLESLDFSSLSPVIRDAVKAAQSLSIPYLWVDSLCILQDDDSDWQRQCSQMHKIYGKARVTLVAASSRTCREGFLTSKGHYLRFPYNSAQRSDISGSFLIKFTHVSAFSRKKSPPDLTLVEDLYNDLNLSQWARRGWTFQEDIMSSARIVYGAVGVYFGRDNKYTSKDGFAGFVNPKLLTSSQSKNLWHQAWENVTYRYSVFTASSFTRPTDILSALSGLAKHFGELLQVEYIAGHWVDRLHHSLMWADTSEKAHQSLNDIIKRGRQKPYLLPTWSCLARGTIRSVIPHNTKQCQSQITVLEVQAPTVGDNPYGAIQDASVTIQGFVLHLASLSWSDSSLPWSESITDFEGTLSGEAKIRFFDIDVSQSGSLKFDDPKPPSGTIGTGHDYTLSLDFQFQYGGDLSKHIGLTRTLPRSLDQVISRGAMLLLGSVEVHQELDNAILKSTYGYGLVLVSMEDQSECSYLRVGTFFPKQTETKGRRDSVPCLKRLFKKDTIKIC